MKTPAIKNYTRRELASLYGIDWRTLKKQCQSHNIAWPERSMLDTKTVTQIFIIFPPPTF